MSVHGNVPSVKAGGTIRVSRFIKMSTTENATVLEGTAGALCIGISGESAREAPQSGSNVNAALDGDVFDWTGFGSETLLTADATGWTVGDLLKSDAAGLGDVAATADDIACAIALETTAASEKGRVLMISPHRIHA